MPRLIDADTLKHKWWCDTNGTKHAMLISIDEAPTIDAQPVVHAHWAFLEPGTMYCSHCEGQVHVGGNYLTSETKAYIQGDKHEKYCPWCGAMMNEKEKDDD